MTKLDEVCLDLAWSHWTALGVRGVFAPPDDTIDLEALILFTATLREIDPRLRDEALDWCVQFARGFVSVSRLRRLLDRLPEPQREDFARFATAAHQHVDLKWSGASRTGEHHRLSGKSRLPSPLAAPSLLQLRARCLIGVNARVEILVAMMTGHAATTWSASELARLGYAKQNISTVLDELARAEVLERTQQGNQHRYRLVRADALRSLLAPIPRAASPWMLRLPILAGLRAAVARVEHKPAIVRDVEIAKEVGAHVPALLALGVAEQRIPTRGHASQVIDDWAIETLIQPAA